MSRIKIGAQVTAKVCPTKVAVSGTFQGYELQDKEDPTSVCGKVFYVKDGMQLLDFVYVDSIKVCKGEDEDERIRKELIEYLTHRSEVTGFIDEDKDCKRWIAYFEKQKEQKPESCDCSRDEESYTNGIHHVLMNPEAYGLIKQKPAEWSEEDKHCIHQLILFCENCMQQDSEAIRCATWLKSLRPQSHWKPSEEQMKALEYFIRSWGESGTMSPQNTILCAANSLYSDLKKLL